MNPIKFIPGLALVAFLQSGNAFAHAMSDSFLKLETHATEIRGEWHIAVRDLNTLFDVDVDGNDQVTWGELKAKHAQIESYALDRLAIATPGAACKLVSDQQLVDRHGDGVYDVIRFHGTCEEDLKSALNIKYGLLFEKDAEHRGLLNLKTADGIVKTGVFSKESPSLTVMLGEQHPLDQALGFVRTGVWHIWEGYDHILFLLTLLFPAALTLRRGSVTPTARFKDVLTDVLKVVTSFTIAHSLTLALASLGVVSPPSRIVESAIAISVLFSAMNNIGRWVGEKRWVVAFAFGLIHGFGFAGVLTDLGLARQSLLTALVAFNVGVELGQLTIVLALLPILFVFRKTNFYRCFILVGGSAVAAGLALCWIIERAADVKFMPF